jgi:EAL domain-containing protein (putative c-di-GMP-specific phosphodiesterase class I)
MVTDTDDAVIVHSTINLAHSLGKNVVAEGVETREVLDYLLRLGCDMAQGYHFCRALPAAECLDFIKRHRPN